MTYVFLSLESSEVLRSGGLKVRLAQVDCVGEFKIRGVAESLVMTNR